MRARFFIATQRWPFVPIYAVIYSFATAWVAWRLARTPGVVAVYLRGSATETPVYGISDLDFVTLVADSRPETVLRVHDQLDLWHRLLPMVEAGGRTGVIPVDRLDAWLHDDPLLRLRLRGARLLRGPDILADRIPPLDLRAEGAALLASTWATARRVLSGPADAARGYTLYKVIIDLWRATRMAQGDPPPTTRAACAPLVPGADLRDPLAPTDRGLATVIDWLRTLGPPPGPDRTEAPQLDPGGDTDPHPREIGRDWIEAGPARLPLGAGRAEWRDTVPPRDEALRRLRDRFDHDDLRRLGRRGLGRVIATILVAQDRDPQDLDPRLRALYDAADEPAPLDELNDALATIAQLLGRPAPPAPPRLRLSVVVCTRNRAPLLARTLHALRRQDRPADEVVIVDNGSTDGTGALLDEVRDLPLRRVHLPDPSIPAARNAGAEAATGDILCYTDDDAVPAPGWLAAIEAAFQRDPEIGMVGGETLAIEEPGVLSAFFAHYMGRPTDPLTELVPR